MQVPESMKGVWDNIAASVPQKITEEQFTKLGDAANEDGDIDNDEASFLQYVKSEFMGTASKKESPNPVSFVDNQSNVNAYSVNSSDVPPSLKSTWLSLTSDGNLTVDKYEKLLQSIPAGERVNGKITPQMEGFFKVLKNSLSDNGGSISIVNQGFNSNVSSGTSEFGKVPENLKAIWNEVSADGQISVEDLDKMILTAAPGQKADEIGSEEMSFLKKFDDKLIASNGKAINLNGNQKTTKGSVNSSSSGKVLLDWPGYTQETKNALKNAYGNLVAGSKMPILSQQAALQVAQSFGASSVEELQSAIHAKVDGKFGPETFFKLKLFAANAINNSNNPQTLANLSGILGALGNDPEVENMRQLISAKSAMINTKTDVEEVTPQKQTEETKVKPEQTSADPLADTDKIEVTEDKKEAVADKKDPTRIDASKQLLSKLGIDLGSFKIEKPQDQDENGDLKLIGNGTELVIFDNLQQGRESENFGDLNISGTVNGKKVDISYWENERRVKKSNVVVDFFTKDAVEKNGKFHLKYIIDGKETDLKSNEGFLKQPLVLIKK